MSEFMRYPFIYLQLNGNLLCSYHDLHQFLSWIAYIIAPYIIFVHSNADLMIKTFLIVKIINLFKSVSFMDKNQEEIKNLDL